jgi:hypothetical protein
MRSSINRPSILRLTIKTLRVCGVAGLCGFLLATAIDQLGANQADIQAPTIKINVPKLRPPVAPFDRRQDRSAQSDQQTAKADMLIMMPAGVSTHFINVAQVTDVEIADLPALNSPMRLAPWVDGVTTGDAAATRPVNQITPDWRNMPTGAAPINGLASNLQGRLERGSTADRSGKAASGLAGRAVGAFGIWPGTWVPLREIVMTLNERLSETLRNIRNLEKSGQRRFIYAAETEQLTNLGLVEKQPGVGPSYRLTARGWQALELAEERLSLLVTL